MKAINLTIGVWYRRDLYRTKAHVLNKIGNSNLFVKFLQSAYLYPTVTLTKFSRTLQIKLASATK